MDAAALFSFLTELDTKAEVEPCTKACEGHLVPPSNHFVLFTHTRSMCSAPQEAERLFLHFTKIPPSICSVLPLKPYSSALSERMAAERWDKSPRTGHSSYMAPPRQTERVEFLERGWATVEFFRRSRNILTLRRKIARSLSPCYRRSPLPWRSADIPHALLRRCLPPCECLLLHPLLSHQLCLFSMWEKEKELATYLVTLRATSSSSDV